MNVQKSINALIKANSNTDWSRELADRCRKSGRINFNECGETCRTLYEEEYGPQWFKKHYGAEPEHGVIQESVLDDFDDLILWVEFYPDEEDSILYAVIINIEANWEYA